MASPFNQRDTPNDEARRHASKTIRKNQAAAVRLSLDATQQNHLCPALCDDSLQVSLRSAAGVGPFDKPLDMLGALSLSKRLRVGDPGYKFYLIAEKTLLRVWAFEGERLRQQPTPGPPIAPCLASRARGQRLIRQS